MVSPGAGARLGWMVVNGRRVRCVWPVERPDPAGRLTLGGSHALVFAGSPASRTVGEVVRHARGRRDGRACARVARGRANRGGRDLGRYTERDLVADVPGAAELADSSLVNAWGLAFGPTTPAWVADNGTDASTLYSGAAGATPVAKVPLTVSIPGGAPTGAVFNGSTGFVVHSGSSSGPARFLFSSEAGTITGGTWPTRRR